MSRGFRPHNSAAPSPRRSTAPGAKFSTNTSTRSASRLIASRLAFFLMSTAKLRLFPLSQTKPEDSPRTAESQWRIKSPSPGFSILMTSAPMSPKIRLQWGPDTEASNARTRTPDRASEGLAEGSGGILADLREQIPLGGVGFLPNHYAAHVVYDHLALLLDATRADLENAP